MKRLLVVDDEPHVARVLRVSLAKEGWQIDLATTAPNPRSTPSPATRRTPSSPIVRCPAGGGGCAAASTPTTPPILSGTGDGLA